MTYDEFQQRLGKAGLKLQEFAELVKMNRTSIYNCAKKGEVPSHLAVIAVLLGEMAERGIDFRTALGTVDIAPKKPRGAGGGNFGEASRNRDSSQVRTGCSAVRHDS